MDFKKGSGFGKSDTKCLAEFAALQEDFPLTPEQQLFFAGYSPCERVKLLTFIKRWSLKPAPETLSIH